MKVLVIEDTQELATNLVRFLSLKWVQADISFDGKDGLHKAATKYYDAIILDINLPEIDGLDVCKQLREKEKNVPIIMLTSRSGKDDIITWLEAVYESTIYRNMSYRLGKSWSKKVTWICSSIDTRVWSTQILRTK